MEIVPPGGRWRAYLARRASIRREEGMEDGAGGWVGAGRFLLPGAVGLVAIMGFVCACACDFEFEIWLGVRHHSPFYLSIKVPIEIYDESLALLFSFIWHGSFGTTLSFFSFTDAKINVR